MLDAGARVIDLSGAFRLRTPENYTAWYKEPHTRPDLLAEAIYGLPEFCRQGIPAARLVANHCDGFHLELPSMEVERIRHLGPDAIATCESCERILIPPSALEG